MVFKSCILTGAVINSKYIEPRQFLETASEIVLDRVRDVLQKHDILKINTMFNGEFVAGDAQRQERQHKKLFCSFDLRKWYELHVIEPTSLEEFQKRDSEWALSRILNLAVNINKSFARGMLHRIIAGNYDEESGSQRTIYRQCVFWSVVVTLHPVKRNSERRYSYPDYASVLNLKDTERH